MLYRFSSRRYLVRGNLELELKLAARQAEARGSRSAESKPYLALPSGRPEGWPVAAGQRSVMAGLGADMS